MIQAERFERLITNNNPGPGSIVHPAPQVPEGCRARSFIKLDLTGLDRSPFAPDVLTGVPRRRYPKGAGERGGRRAVFRERLKRLPGLVTK